jgi:cytoskeleton protein RodZ
MLRQARERLGLSLADVAAVTRVPRNMLEHLERDRFTEYAAPVFARGHLINFAREVRLDPERVLLAYERQTGLVRPSLEFEPPVHPPRSRSRKPATTTRTPSVAVSKRLPKVAKLSEFVRPIHMVTALLLMCALFASAFFLNGSSATAQNPAEFSNTTSDEEGWSLEKDADQARWFLEQPAAAQTTSDP